MLREVILALFSAFFGFLLCFAGYRFFMVMLPVWTFFGGFWLGAKGTNLLFGGGFLATATGLTVGLVLGILLAIFSWQFYELGVAILAGAIGAWFGANGAQFLGFKTGVAPVMAGLLSALFLGGFTLVQHWQRYVVMGLSAIAGATSLVLSLLLLIGRVSIPGLQGAGSAVRAILQDSWFWSLLWIALAIVGVIVQVRNYRYYTFARQEFAKYWS